MAVIVVHMRDAEVRCSKEDIDAMLWRDYWSVKGAFEQNSFGHVEFAGDLRGSGGAWDIFGPVTLDISLRNEKECTAFDWAIAADALAVAQEGMRLEDYQHRVYILPRATDDLCHWEGLGTVTCPLVCRAWVNECWRMEVFVHELGHNLGLSHADSDLGERGDLVKYGDPTAFMGNSFFYSDEQLSFNAPHKAKLAWLSAVKHAASGGRYRIYPANVNQGVGATDRPQALTVSSSGTTYFFSFMTLRSPYSHRCLVHRQKHTWESSYFVAALEGDRDMFIGRSYRFAVTQWEVGEDYMDLDVSFNCEFRPTYVDFFAFAPPLAAAPFADRETPQVVFNRTLELVIGAGDEATLAIRVGNMDTLLCTPTHYQVTVLGVLPSGWNVTVPDAVVVPAGQTCYLECTVRTSRSAAAGSAAEISFRIAGVTQDGRTVPDHNVTLVASVLVAADRGGGGGAQCISVPPELRLGRDEGGRGPAPFFAPGGSAFFAFRLVNRNGPRCAAAEFEFGAAAPAGWSVDLRSASAVVDSQSVFVNFVTLRVPACAPGVCCENCSVILNATSNSGRVLEAQLDVPLAPEGLCTVPTTLAFPNAPVVAMASRQCFAIPVEVANRNPPHCPAEVFILSAPEGEKTAFPEPHFVLAGGATKRTVVLYTTPVNISSSSGGGGSAEPSNKTLHVALFRSYRHEASAQLLVEVTPALCVRAAPTLIVKAPGNVENSTGFFRVFFMITNHDSWACGFSYFRVTVATDPLMVVESGHPLDGISLFPGNLTGYIGLNISLPSGGTGGIASLALNITVSDTPPAQDPAHVVGQHLALAVGRCVRGLPIVEPAGNYSDVPLALGDTTRTIAVVVRQNYTAFCSWAFLYRRQRGEGQTVQVRLEQHDGFLLSAKPKGSFTLGFARSQRIQMYITATATAALGMANLSLQFVDPRLSGRYTRIPLGVRVTDTCVVHFLILALSPAVRTIPVGRSLDLQYELSVSNRDERACPNSTFGFKFVPPNPASGWRVVASPAALALAPQTTAYSNLTISTRANVPAGDYSIKVWVHEPSFQTRVSHVASLEVPVRTECAAPRPVSGIQIRPVVPIFTFGLQAGPVFLSWEACRHALWCCCPCTYEIRRNGVLIGTSTLQNYTDSTQLRAGKRYVYSVTTVDSRGVASSAAVCENLVVFEIEPPSVTSLIFFLLSVAAGMAFAFLLARACVYFCRNRKALQQGRSVRGLTHAYRLWVRFKRSHAVRSCGRAMRTAACFLNPARCCRRRQTVELASLIAPDGVASDE